MRRKLTKEMSDYIEGVNFLVSTYETIVQMQFIPSKYVEIDTATKEFYDEKLIKAKYEFNQLMFELRKEHFPEAEDHDSVNIDFQTQTITLVKGKCSCGGSCSR